MYLVPDFILVFQLVRVRLFLALWADPPLAVTPRHPFQLAAVLFYYSRPTNLVRCRRACTAGNTWTSHNISLSLSFSLSTLQGSPAGQPSYTCVLQVLMDPDNVSGIVNSCTKSVFYYTNFWVLALLKIIAKLNFCSYVTNYLERMWVSIPSHTLLLVTDSSVPSHVTIPVCHYRSYD